MKMTKIQPAPVEQRLTLEVSAFELEVILHSLAHVSSSGSDPSPARVAGQLFDAIDKCGAVSFSYGRLESDCLEGPSIIVREGCVAPAEIWNETK